MKTRNSPSCACCGPVGPQVIEWETLLRAFWSDYQGGFTPYMRVFVAPPGDQIIRWIEPLAFFGSDAFAAVFRANEVPQALSTCLMQFHGYCSGTPEPNQTIRIYADEFDPSGDQYFPSSMPSVDWVQGSGDVWGLDPGTIRTTIDIAGIVNTVTSRPTWNQATDRLIIITRSMTLQTAASPVRFLKNVPPVVTLLVT